MTTTHVMMTKPTLGAEPRLRGYSVELRELARSLQSQLQQPLPLGLDHAARIDHLIEQAELRNVAHELMQLLILSDDRERRARGGTLTRAELETLRIAGATLARKLDTTIGERKRKRQVKRKHGLSGLPSDDSDMRDQILEALLNELRQLYELLASMMKNYEDMKQKPIQHFR